MTALRLAGRLLVSLLRRIDEWCTERNRAAATAHLPEAWVQQHVERTRRQQGGRS